MASAWRGRCFLPTRSTFTGWSVLGGIAVAALLTELDSVPLGVEAGRWGVALYFLVTCLVIVNSWVQTAWASLILKWPILISTSLSLFFLGLSVSVAALNITQTTTWHAAMSVVLLAGLFNQQVFTKNHAWIVFSPEVVDRARAIAYTVSLPLRPDILVELRSGLLAFAVSPLALIRQHLEMVEEKNR